MSAQGILRTMGTLVISLVEKTDILAEIERVLMPVIGAVSKITYLIYTMKLLN
jgi:hypothetical protein